MTSTMQRKPSSSKKYDKSEAHYLSPWSIVEDTKYPYESELASGYQYQAAPQTFNVWDYKKRAGNDRKNSHFFSYSSSEDDDRSSLDGVEITNDNWIWCGADAEGKYMYDASLATESRSSTISHQFDASKDKQTPHSENESTRSQRIAPADNGIHESDQSAATGNIHKRSTDQKKKRKSVAQTYKKWERCPVERKVEEESKGSLSAMKYSYQSMSKSSNDSLLYRQTRSSTDKLVPYGARSHSYVSVKKCCSNIYESRMKEKMDLAETRKRIQQYYNKVCLHCCAVYPDGKCRPTMDCMNFRKKVEQIREVLRKNGGESKKDIKNPVTQRKLFCEDRDSAQNLNVHDVAVSEKTGRNKLDQDEMSLEAHVETRRRLSHPTHASEYTEHGDYTKKTQKRMYKKYLIDFDELDQTKCRITARRSVLIPESLKVIKLMIVEVDVLMPSSDKTTCFNGNCINAETNPPTLNASKATGDILTYSTGIPEITHDISSFQNHTGEIKRKEPSNSAKEKKVKKSRSIKSSAVAQGNVDQFGQSYRISAQDVTIALEIQESTESISDAAKFLRTKLPWSDEFSRFGCPTILKCRTVTDACFCPSQPNMLMTLHSKPDQDPDNFPGMLICVWNTHKPSLPRSILAGTGYPNCICWSPTSAALAFAGMSDGSVAVWDLEKPDSTQRIVNIKRENFVVRYPAFCTIHGEETTGHVSPVVTIASVRNKALSCSTVISEKLRASVVPDLPLSFQVATLEEAGIIIFWQVVKAPPGKGNSKESKFKRGLKSRHKITLTLTLQVGLSHEVSEFLQPVSLGTLILQLTPIILKKTSEPDGDTNSFEDCKEFKYSPQFQVGAYHGKSSPIYTIDFSPFCSFYFLAGYKDGSVFLCHTQKQKPVLSFVPEQMERKPVLKVEWSPFRPAVFFALTGDSTLNVYDLLEDKQLPVRIMRFHRGAILTMALSPDLRPAVPRFPFRPHIMLACSDGSISIRTLNKIFTEKQGLDEEKFLENLAESN